MDDTKTIVMTGVSSLTPYPNNPRKHSKAQVQQIAESIKAFGFTNPVLVDANGMVLAGHGRLEAAKLLGMTGVPTLCIDTLSEPEKAAYIIADNRLTEKSSWDDDLLATELQGLMIADTTFDITVTGFEMPEIDLKVQGIDEPDMDGDDELPAIPINPVSRLGDIWLMGNHRLICGDALKTETYAMLMTGEVAQMVLTDPPYNVKIAGHVSGKGKVVHDEFAMASGEMGDDEFRNFLATACGHMTRHSADGSIHYIFMDWRHIETLLYVGKTAYAELKNLAVWCKDNGGMGSLYRSRHELVAIFKNGDAPHINNVELGKYGRYRTNVWNYRGMSSMRAGRDKQLAMHPTVKPVRMLADAMMDCSNPGGLVLDPFGGSGSTLIAAERTGRHARLVELEPKYVDVAIIRWQELMGLEAVNAETGKTFAETKVERQA